MTTGTLGTEARHLLGERDERQWQRHPGDVARLVFRLAALAVLLIATALTPTALRSASVELIELAALLPTMLRDALVGVAQTATLLIPLAVVAWLLLRRTLAAAALVAGAAVVGGITMSLLLDWLDRAAPPELVEDLPTRWIVATDFPSATFVAALVAGATAASPLMVRRWRRVAWFGVGVALAVRLLSATQAPVNLAVTLALGSVVGSAALVLVGSPMRRPGAASLRASLAAAGLVVDDLADAGAVAGRRTYRGAAGGTPLLVAYLDRDDRDADLLARIFGAVRVHSIDHESLSLDPRRRVEHEALVTLLAGRAGAAVPTCSRWARRPRRARSSPCRRRPAGRCRPTRPTTTRSPTPRSTTPGVRSARSMAHASPIARSAPPTWSSTATGSPSSG